MGPMEIREGVVMDIHCPACNSEDVNMRNEQVQIENVPQEHGWYGQSHRTHIPMFCESCHSEFCVRVSAYKNRASVVVEVR